MAIFASISSPCFWMALTTSYQAYKRGFGRDSKDGAHKDPITAAEGSVLFLEKVSAALAHVDSSSGALGSAVNYAIVTLVPIITKAIVPDDIRQCWLKRLWIAIEED